ncbi:hypothetical protein E3E14_16705 [Streptomyces sp. ICN441]|uniref:hypothetical protein n=1 Tax=Streptomyces sp. ICN441 TaxID=2558286 RepID=UPI00106B89D5|nr:hypothetical protein [Streptomyces sp. ICN441]TFE49005.1 hypothetical protein E3E14_16705 [Streptomyces sp. ICN441]
MSETFEELEDRYKAALNRVSKAHRDLQDILGDPKPLAPGEEPPVLTKAERDAQTEAMQAFQVYVPLRDRYWATRWGREGNPPKP